MKNLNYIGLILTIMLAGASMPLAFGPFNFWPIAIIALSVLSYFINYKTKSIFQAIIYGYLFAIPCFAVGVSWIYISIYYFGNAPIWLAVALTLFLILYNATYIAASTGTYFWLKEKFNTRIKFVIVWPTIWLIFELLRGYLLTGFPWLYAGYGLIDSPFQGIATWFSVYGLSWTCLLLSVFLAKFWHRINIYSFFILSLEFVCVIIISYGLQTFTDTQIQELDQPIKIGIVQGNIKPNDTNFLRAPIEFNKNIYLKNSAAIFAKTDLIIWPENALPAWPDLKLEEYLDHLNQLSNEFKVNIIFGMPRIANIRPIQFYNSMLCTGHGNNLSVYDKTKLVPFGEYLPLDKYLRGLNEFFNLPMSQMIPATTNQPCFITPKAKIAAAICWEMAFPNFIREKFANDQENIDLLLTISEDGWFGRSLGPHQHLDIARMRALENGKPVVRATSTGISGYINANGKIITILKPNELGVIIQEIKPTKGVTPWVKFGILHGGWLLLFLITSLLAISCIIRYDNEI